MAHGQKAIFENITGTGKDSGVFVNGNRHFNSPPLPLDVGAAAQIHTGDGGIVAAQYHAGDFAPD